MNALALVLAVAPAVEVPPLPPGTPIDAAHAGVLERLRGTEVPASYIDAAFADPRVAVIQSVADRFNNPPPGQGEAMPWEEYRRRIVSEERIAAGVGFLGAHGAEASAAASAYGVDRGVIAAIAGVETFYGRNTGAYSVFNVYYTVANLVPKRASWGVKELASVIRIAYNDGSDAHAVNGSWAGAFGYVQFIPSSLLAYGVDGDGDGRRDLYAWPDALASAANYLHKNGYPAGTTDFSDRSPAYWSVYAYNHSDNYARAVLALRGEILRRLSTPRPSAR